MKGTKEELTALQEKIVQLQQSTSHHPLTCENDSKGHPNLIPEFTGSGSQLELRLFCKQCDWEQDIPPFLKSLCL